MSVRAAGEAELATCLDIRMKVFVEEQGVPVEEERDAYDDAALHVIGEVDAVPMGTARVVFLEETAKIGRVCVMKGARGTGLGREMMQFLLEQIVTRPQISRAYLTSQMDAVPFYEQLGFEAFGGIVMDAGIEHREMELLLE